MKKLPFKIQPKHKTTLVGNEETGVLEIPVIGGLKVGEQAIVDEVTKNLPNTFALASRLAVKIDAELQLNDLMFAFDIVATPGWEFDKKEEIETQQKEGKITGKEAQKQLTELEQKTAIFRSARIRYASDLLDLNTDAEKSGRAKQIAAVTAILTRVDDSWTEEDTKDLSDALFQEIWKFVQNEMGDEDSELPTEEDIVKQPEATAETPASIGQTSTGESSDISPTSIDSKEKVLASNPVG